MKEILLNKEIIKYGLLHTKKNKVLGFSISSNFCVSETYSLDDYSDNMWSVDSIARAEWVRNNSTEWYDADYNTPNHDFEANELKGCEDYDYMGGFMKKIIIILMLLVFILGFSYPAGHSNTTFGKVYVKMLKSLDLNVLETLINNWLKDTNVIIIDIRYSVCQRLYTNGENEYSVLIMYTK